MLQIIFKMIIFIQVGYCIFEGKDEAMASRGAIFQSVAGRESGVTFLVTF